MRYTKKSDDLSYRIVNVAKMEVDDYRSFETSTVEYPKGCVLEVLKEDQSERIEYDDGKINIPYFSKREEKKLFFKGDAPTARLWIRSTAKTGMWYKVPERLNKKDDYVYMQLSCDPLEVELCGDKYFEAVYELCGQ